MKKVMLFVLSFLLTVCTIGGVVNVNAAESEGMGISCKAAYLCDWRSGTVINELESTKHLPIASMCKIMTLILCFDAIENGSCTLQDEVSVSETASGMGGSQVFLETGGNYAVGELIKSICIASANDSCVAMAEFLCGGEDVFVNKMNERAKNLGMNDTVFVNCTGLPKTGQFSCAKDVAIMLSELLRHQEYYNYSKIWMDEMVHPGGRKTEMANTNKLIRYYQGCDAGKTGFTSEAGFCLAASAQRGSMRVISVVIGADSSKTRFDNCKSMFDFAFANYANKAVIQEEILANEFCPVKGGKEKTVSVKPACPIYVFTKKGDKDEYFYKTSYNQVKAPVKVGDIVGEVVFYKNNVEVGKTELLSVDKIERLNYFDSIKDIAENWNF